MNDVATWILALAGMLGYAALIRRVLYRSARGKRRTGDSATTDSAATRRTR